MELKGKALYNLLRISWLEDPCIEVKPWQVEDYRVLSEDHLFSRLKHLGIILDRDSFLVYAEDSDCPEELVECLWLDEEDEEGSEQVFLLICELWRRLLPDRLPLSLFCDELDQMIERYDKGVLEDEELLQEALGVLEDILDETADLGQAPRDAFQKTASYCAHDLEHFIYDYISDQIDLKNELIASELLDSFYGYMSDSKPFDFLRARLFAESDAAEGNLLIARLLEQLVEEPDLSLLLEMAQYLVHRGDVHLFMQVVRQAIPLLQREEDFQQLLLQIADYYRCLDREEEEKAVESLLKKRELYPLDERIDPSDVALRHIRSVFTG